MRTVYIIIWVLITAVLSYILYEWNEKQMAASTETEITDDKIQVIDAVSGSAYTGGDSEAGTGETNSDNQSQENNETSEDGNSSDNYQNSDYEDSDNATSTIEDSESNERNNDSDNLDASVQESNENSNTNRSISDEKFLEKANIEFNQNKTTLQKSEKLESYLDSVVQVVNSSDLYVLLEGHADKSLSKKHNNYEVGLKRANFIKNALISRGLSEEKVVVVSKGDADPIIDSDSPEARKSNRRVELIIKQKN